MIRSLQILHQEDQYSEILQYDLQILYGILSLKKHFGIKIAEPQNCLDGSSDAWPKIAVEFFDIVAQKFDTCMGFMR